MSRLVTSSVRAARETGPAPHPAGERSSPDPSASAAAITSKDGRAAPAGTPAGGSQTSLRGHSVLSISAASPRHRRSTEAAPSSRESSTRAPRQPADAKCSSRRHVASRVAQVTARWRGDRRSGRRRRNAPGLRPRRAFSSSTRTASLRIALARGDVRDRRAILGAATGLQQSSGTKAQEQAELVGLPAIACRRVRALRVAHVLAVDSSS